jgi:hypothetical protein
VQLWVTLSVRAYRYVQVLLADTLFPADGEAPAACQPEQRVQHRDVALRHRPAHDSLARQDEARRLQNSDDRQGARTPYSIKLDLLLGAARL